MMNFALSLAAVVMLLGSLHPHPLEANLCKVQSVSEDELSEDVWDYQPRIWSFDGPKSLVEEDEQVTLKKSTGDWDNYPEDQVDQGDTTSFQEPPNRDPHESHYFVGSSKSQYLSSSRLDLKQGLGRAENNKRECSQFWVDVREAIICDKNRCDKLDFEWPKYDNQISIIQTTRDGMRFKQIDLAMNSNKMKKSRHILQEVQSSENRRTSQRVKIDFMEFLKPKPTSSTTSTTTTTPSSPDSSTTSPDSTTTTTSTTLAPNDDDHNEDDPDIQVNKTKLITTLRLDTKRLKQKMIGFGGALSDSTCRNIKSLSPEMAESLMEDYFGSRGLRYNIGRLSIGSSDFSTTPYTNNDKPDDLNGYEYRFADSVGNGTRDDVEMKNFKLVKEDLEFKIPIARQAMATATERELKLFASMWSPPIWMKNNSHIVHGYLKGDIYGPYYRGLAELILRWFEAYRSQGIEFWATTGLNEPVTGIQEFIFHNSLGMTKRDYLTFLKLYLGPMLRQRKFGDMKLLLLDDNKGFLPNYVKSAMKDAQLSSLISGIAYHWYMNDEYENLDFIARDYPSKFILSSEASNGYLPFQVHTLPGDWDRGVAYMIDIIKGVQHSSSGWVDWNMVLDLGGGPSWAKNNLDAAIIVNRERDEYYKSPTFYALGHFSRFIEPDSYRLDQILSNARYDMPLDAVAFLTPSNYTVIVALNANKSPIPIRIVVNKRQIRIVPLRPQSFTTIIFKAPSN